MSSSTSLFAELEGAVKNGSPEKPGGYAEACHQPLPQRVRSNFNEKQIGMFDDVLGHQIQRIETKALVQLSEILAPVDDAPIEVVRRLSRHDEITIAGPVLASSNRLSESDLIDIVYVQGTRPPVGNIRTCFSPTWASPTFWSSRTKVDAIHAGSRSRKKAG